MVKKLNSQEYWLTKIKKDLDDVGPGFCLLKWYYLELSLAEGLKHSCYHCPQHKIPTDSDLHNTPYTKAVRREMLEGGKPAEDAYCYDIEETGNFSDRQMLAVQFLKNDPDLIAKTAAIPANEDVWPRYLTVSFTNKCQMSCSYCGAGKSSTWQKELDKHGSYDLKSKPNHDKYIPRSDILIPTQNPDVKKFWKWLPEAYPHLNTIRLTGGEPLLDANTFKLLQYVKDHPKENLSFEISTNLMATERRVLEYIYLVKDLPDQKCYVSIDSWGDQAEYIRNGLKMDRFEENLHKVLGNGVPVGIMCTFCFLSIPNFEQFIFKVAELKNTYGDLVTVDMPNMVEPLHLTARIADDNVISILDRSLESMKSFDNIFQPYEIMKLQRTTDWIKTNRFEGLELKVQREDFVSFVDEHDRRRGTDFITTFPELGGFYGRIKASN